jgi:uncharacterized protein
VWTPTDWYTDAMDIVYSLLTGLAAGVLGGMFGVGGGILIVPACVYFMGMSLQRAQGTSLALLLLPVGILGVLNYSKTGNIDWRVAGFIAIAFVFGAYFGSKISLSLDEAVARKIFAGFLVLVAIQMFFKK